MVQPVDYGSILRSGSALVPDLANQMLQQQQMQLATRQEDRLSGIANREAAEKQAYVAKATEVFRKPSPENIAELQAMFPKQHEAIQSAWSNMHKSAKERDVQQLANIWGAVRNGRFDVAGKWARERYDADVKGGMADDMDRLIVETLEKGTDEERAQVAGLLGSQLLGAVGPDKFWSSYESFSEGQRRDALLPLEIQKEQADVATKQAEAKAAPVYYAARAQGEKAQAEIRETDADWREAYNRDRSNLSKMRQRGIISTIKRAAGYKGKAVGKVTAGDVVETITEKANKGGLSQADLDAWSTYKKGKFKEGQVATNGAGQRIIFKGGRWVIDSKAKKGRK